MSTEGTPPRVSDEKLERGIIEQGDYFASFRAGIDCIGGAQAKAGFDALLDLRDARQRIADLEAERDRLMTDVASMGFDLLATDHERDALQSQVAALREALVNQRMAHASLAAVHWRQTHDEALEELNQTSAWKQGTVAITDTAAAAEAYTQRLIQRGRDEERMEIRERGILPNIERVECWYKERAEGWDVIGSGAYESLAAEFAAVRQQGREEGTRDMRERAAVESHRVAEAYNSLGLDYQAPLQCERAIAALPIIVVTPQPDTEGTKP